MGIFCDIVVLYIVSSIYLLSSPDGKVNQIPTNSKVIYFSIYLGMTYIYICNNMYHYNRNDYDTGGIQG